MKKKWWIQKVLTCLLIATLVLQPVPLSMMQITSIVSSAQETDGKDEEQERKEEEEKKREEEEQKRKEEEEKKREEEEEKKRQEEEAQKKEEAGKAENETGKSENSEKAEEAVAQAGETKKEEESSGQTGKPEEAEKPEEAGKPEDTDQETVTEPVNEAEDQKGEEDNESGEPEEAVNEEPGKAGTEDAAPEAEKKEEDTSDGGDDKDAAADGTKEAAEAGSDAGKAAQSEPAGETAGTAETAKAADTAAPAAEAPAEDAAAAKTEEAPVEMPAKSFSGGANGLSVTVKAEEGTFPAGTSMKVEYVSSGSVMEAVQGAVEGEVKKVKAVDITFRYKGKEIQPEKPVKVTISASGMDSSLDHEIVHIDDHKNNVVETVVDKGDMPGTKGSFEADGFSIYAVVETGETGEDARLTVNFVKADGSTAALLINQRQVDQIELYIYDPGAGTLPEDTDFMGWSSDQNYDADSTPLTIADIREAVEEKLNAGVQEGDEITYYAMVFKPYTVTYLDERSIHVKTAQILVRPDDDSTVTHEISLNYTPYPSEEEGAVAEFMGWQQVTPEIPGEMKLYQVGDTIELEETEYVLKAYTQTGHWIIYEENLSNAPYTQPEFVPIGETPTEPAAPARSGYTFDGWYTEDASGARDGQVAGSPYDFSQELESNTTVYGKWTQGNRANYSVMIWFQNKLGTGYDYSGTTITVNNATVGNDTYNIEARGTGNGRYARIRTGTGNNNYTDFNRLGFHLSTDQGTGGQGYDSPVPVAAEGNTVLHVYYDRNEITYHFRYSNQRTETFTGLYGSDFSGWPDPGNNQTWTRGGIRFPLPLTVFDPESIEVGNNDTEFTFTLTNYTTNYTLYVYKMTETGAWSYTPEYLVATARLSGGGGGCGGGNTWYPTEEYDGYELDSYRRGANGTWQDADPETGIRITSDLYLRYARKQYDIVYNDGVFVDGSGAAVEDAPAARTAFQTENNIYYEADISGKDFEPELNGFVFLGWYDNEACAGDPYYFDKMPANNVTLYAKWGRNEYEVEFHANDSADDPIIYSDGTSEKPIFYADEGDRVGNPGGERLYYDLVGWYTDAALKRPFNYDAIVINKANITKYGTIYSDSEIDPDYPTTIGKLDLYAKWRSKLIGAEGINVEYDANGGTDAPEDGNFYVDQAEAVAQGASTPADATTYVFSHWEVQKWNGSAYEPSGVKVYPGEAFEVLADDAKITDSEENVVAKEDLDPKGEYTYTVQLKAEYIEKDREVLTHIYWFRNDGTAAFQKDEDLKINEAVDVPAAPERDGYDFIGWARVEIPGEDITVEDAREWEEDSSNWTQDVTEANLVTYVDGAYSHSKVAADENHPYHAVFAVWKEKEVTINYAVASDSEDMGTVSTESETVKAITGTASGSTASPADGYAFDYWTCDDGTDHVSDSAEFVPEKNDDGVYEEHTYYAHFKLSAAEVTVHHYLKGTTTQVKEDDTETVMIGETYTATPATTYQEKDLTVDSYDPSQTITVKEDENVITIYYTLPLTITSKTDSKVYDGQPLAGEYTIEGALTDDEAAIKTALGEAPSITNVSESPKEYLTEAEQGEITGMPAYYVVAYTSGTLTITPLPIKIITGSDEKVYDGEPLTNTADLSVVGDGPSGAGPFIAVAEIEVTGTITDVGTTENTYEITWAEGAEEGNFDIKDQLGTLEVTPLPIKIITGSDEKVYDGEPLTNTADTSVSGEGPKGADPFIKVAEIETTGTITDVGTTENTYEIIWAEGAKESNFEITDQLGTLEVTKAAPPEIVVTDEEGNILTDGAEKVYDGKPLKGTAKATLSITGADGETTELDVPVQYSTDDGGTWSDEAPSITDVGELTVQVRSNYKNAEEATASYTLKVTERPITVRAKDGSKVYDGKALKAEDTGYEITEGTLAEGETEEVTLSGEQTLVGSSPAVVSTVTISKGDTDTTKNYKITTEDGTLKVTDGTEPEDEETVDDDLVVTKTVDDKEYGLGETVTFTVTATNIYAEAKDITLTEINGVELETAFFKAVEPGATVETTATYVIQEADLLAGEFKNTVTAAVGKIKKQAEATAKTEADEEEPEEPEEEPEEKPEEPEEKPEEPEEKPEEPEEPEEEDEELVPIVPEYEIRYKLNGGVYDGSTEDIVEPHAAGEVIIIHEAPTREGYEFDFWEGSEYYPGDEYTVTGDHVFVAQWKEAEEEKTPAKKHSKSGDSDDDDSSPRTGDDSHAFIWLLVLLLAAAGTFGAVVYRKKNRK